MAVDRYRPSGLGRAAVVLIIVSLHALVLWASWRQTHVACIRKAGSNAVDPAGARGVLRVAIVPLPDTPAGHVETRPRPRAATDSATPAAATGPHRADGPQAQPDAASTRAATDAPAPSSAVPSSPDVDPGAASAHSTAAVGESTRTPVEAPPAATVVRTVDAVLCPPTTVQYPARAVRLGLQGHVQLRLLLGQDGSVREISVADSSGHEILDSAAVTAMRGLRCQPYIEDGRAMPAQVLQLVEFSLTAAH
jgi:periplasmic protein TonB